MWSLWERQPTELQMLPEPHLDRDNLCITQVRNNVKWFHLSCNIPHALQKHMLKILDRALHVLSQVEVWNGEELIGFIALTQPPKMGYQYLTSQFKSSIHLILLGIDRGSDQSSKPRNLPFQRVLNNYFSPGYVILRVKKMSLHFQCKNMKDYDVHCKNTLFPKALPSVPKCLLMS